MNRRDFIKAGLAAGAVAAFGRPPNALAEARRPAQTRWAFLADTHISEDPDDNYRGFWPRRNLRAVVSHILCNPPDGAVVAGDLARLEGKPGDYAGLKELLTPLADETPVFLAPGNHDDRDNLLRAFDRNPGKQDVAGKHVTVTTRPPVRVVTLDSLMFVNKVPGLLGKTQRQWLQEYLSECDETPTILCWHHTLGDGDGDLLDVPRLFRMIRPIRKVKAVVYGHSHVYGLSRFKGIHLINLPAVGYNFSDADPLGWVEAELTAEGGTFTLHAVAGNTDKLRRTRKLTWRK
jgi:Icc protein